MLVAVPPAVRTALVDRFETRTFQKGEWLLTEGEDAAGLHLIAAGAVAVVAREYGERVMLGTLGPGDALGETELVFRRKAYADAIAMQPTATLFLPREYFESLAQDHPALVHGLYVTALKKEAELSHALRAPAIAADAHLVSEAIDLITKPVAETDLRTKLRSKTHGVDMPVAPPPLPAPAEVAPSALSSIPPTTTTAPSPSTRPTSGSSVITPRPIVWVGVLAAIAVIGYAVVARPGKHTASVGAGASWQAPSPVATTEPPPTAETAVSLPVTTHLPSTKPVSPVSRPRASIIQPQTATSTGTSATTTPIPVSSKPGGAPANVAADFGGPE
jgi:hypothetical protein